MIQPKDIKKIAAEVRRFDKALSKLSIRMIQDDIKFHGWQRYPKESGAVKRASMDLTRALAEFRRA